MSNATTATGRGRVDATTEQPELSRAPGSWLRERAWLLDRLVALAVFVYSLPTLPVYSADPTRLAALAVVSAVLCGSYLLRRRYPLVVLGIMLVAACVHPLLGASIIVADFMLLLAVYNVPLWFLSSCEGVV